MSNTPSKSSGSRDNLTGSPYSPESTVCTPGCCNKDAGGYSPYHGRILFPSNTTVLDTLEDSSNAAEVAFILMCDKYIDFSNCC